MEPIVTHAAGNVRRRLYVVKEVSRYARLYVYRVVPWLEEVISVLT
jgi:hypothetical protein